LVDNDSLINGNGLDLINSSSGAIVYGVDLNKIVKMMFVKQREDRDKYCDLSSKTIYLVSEDDYQRINRCFSNGGFKRCPAKYSLTKEQIA
jgi:hypothetical protein